MKPKLRFFAGLILLFGMIPFLCAQEPVTRLVKYSPEFKFDDGFYISFSQVRNNMPIPLVRIITNLDYTSTDFYDKILQGKTLNYFDENGVRQEVPVSKIWGFSRNGILYIKISEGFSRITIVGSIGHFVANITTYNSARYYDPYYNPYYSPYYNPYYGTPRNTRSTEMRQYLIDFETGKLLDYDVQSVEVLLMKDPELHDEFASLSKKKKKQMKFLYIRKFNEKNPLMIPVTTLE